MLICSHVGSSLALTSLEALSQAPVLSFMSLGTLLQRRDASANAALCKYRKQHKNQASNIDASIDRGQRVVAYIHETLKDEASDIIADLTARYLAPRKTRSADPVTGGSQPSNPHDDAIVIEVASSSDGEDDDDQNNSTSMRILPYGFWPKFIVNCQNQRFDKTRQTMYSRALRTYLLSTADGEKTRLGMRGMRARGSCRTSGAARNSVKASGLGFALLQFFVDHVQKLQSRSDSHMLMQKVREMRGVLEAEGVPSKDLPKLIGDAGRQWFWRWRMQYGITKQVIGLKLTVPWRKVKRRVKVLLQNIFRLRAFWELCFPGVAMRFISIDQKPSWFNNAGHTGTYSQKGRTAPTVRENFQKTRERYTILTTVPSWHDVDHQALSQAPVSDAPPKVAVMFKAQPGGSVIKELQKLKLKPWMNVQVQENGSYRSRDMVEALEWILPVANEPRDSIVVLLDWFKGHMTEEVAHKIKSKGHVLLFHGGGCTPYTQVNDTHLHARMLKKLLG